MPSSHQPSILALMGPTASGKTSLALEVLDQVIRKKGRPIEIISVDSVAVYRQFDIGTAKPSSSEQQKTAHHMIDLVDPDQPFNLADYVRIAREKISELQKNGVLPFLVGGSGFYYRGLLEGVANAPPTDPEVEKQILEEINIKGLASVHARLESIDPRSYQTISPNDSYRTVRALAVYQQTGEPFSNILDRHERQKAQPGYVLDPYSIYLKISRPEIKPIVRARTLNMMENGWIEEVQKLIQRGFTPLNSAPMRAIGYFQIYNHLMRPQLEKELENLIVKETMRLVKSQQTWFKKTAFTHQMHPIKERGKIIESLVEKAL